MDTMHIDLPAPVRTRPSRGKTSEVEKLMSAFAAHEKRERDSLTPRLFQVMSASNDDNSRRMIS